MRVRGILLGAALVFVPVTAHAQRAPTPPGLVSLGTEEGEARLARSPSKRDFYVLAGTFVTQKDQSFCPVASGVMVLNALPVEAPPSSEWGAPYKTFTQDNFFNDRARALGVARGGLQLEQLKALLETYPVEAQAVHAGDTTLDEFRRTMASDLADPTGFVIVNFLRSGIGEEPNGSIEKALAGHFSPLGAYDAASDSVLLLDVARYEYPPLWIPTPMLFDAMDTVDSESGKTRGYLLVRAGKGALTPQPAERSHNRLLAIVIAAPLAIFGLGATFRAWLSRRRARARAATS